MLSMQFLLHIMTVLCLSQILLKFGLHRSTPSQILPRCDLPPVDLSVGDVQMLDSTVVTMECLLETTVAFLNGTIADLLQPLLSQHGDLKCTHRTNFTMRAATWRIL